MRHNWDGHTVGQAQPRLHWPTLSSLFVAPPGALYITTMWHYWSRKDIFCNYGQLTQRTYLIEEKRKNATITINNKHRQQVHTTIIIDSDFKLVVVTWQSRPSLQCGSKSRSRRFQSPPNRSSSTCHTKVIEYVTLKNFNLIITDHLSPTQFQCVR